MTDFLEGTDQKANKGNPKATADQPKSEYTEEPTSPAGDQPSATQDLSGKINEVAQKSFAALKTSMDQVSHFASGAKKMGELKLELHHLKTDRDKLLRTIGLRTWRLYQEGGLAGLPEKFAPEFDRLGGMDKRIAETEQNIEAISLRK